MNVNNTKGTTLWRPPMLTSTIQIKALINKGVIITKGGKTKVGKRTQTKGGEMVQIKEGTTTFNHTITNKTNPSNHKTKVRDINHLTKGKLKCLKSPNHKSLKSPTLLLPPIKLQRMIPFALFFKGKESFKRRSPLPSKSLYPAYLYPPTITKAPSNLKLRFTSLSTIAQPKG
ncbi:hypothetical protein AHAS_Ahas20G0169200 [Arachis hypogaea]